MLESRCFVEKKNFIHRLLFQKRSKGSLIIIKIDKALFRLEIGYIIFNESSGTFFKMKCCKKCQFVYKKCNFMSLILVNMIIIVRNSNRK